MPTGISAKSTETLQQLDGQLEEQLVGVVKMHGLFIFFYNIGL